LIDVKNWKKDEEDGRGPWIVIEDEQHRRFILDIISFDDHLCIDVHAFNPDGSDARTGFFGMDNGRRYTINDAPGRSHSWDATKLVVLMNGEQTTKEN
jgi:hypothetical protein